MSLPRETSTPSAASSVSAIVQIPAERGERGLTGVEARPVGGADEPDAPAQHRRDGAWPDAERAVTRGECLGRRAQHPRPGER